LFFGRMTPARAFHGAAAKAVRRGLYDLDEFDAGALFEM
jgi:hypothetical protein